MTLQKSLYVPEYLLIHKENDTDGFKKMKRKLTKRKAWKCFTVKTYKSFETDSIQIFKDYLVHVKKTYQNKHSNAKTPALGFISDKNNIDHDINLLPPPPQMWDVLCIQGNVEKYKFSDPANTIYWCKSEISSTENVIVNYESIDTILTMIKDKKVKTWADFIKHINGLDLYIITQYQMSSPRQVGDVDKVGMVNTSRLVSSFETWYNQQTDEDQYKVWPKVSLLCVLTNPHGFFHTLNTFLRLRYPRDKLELVIVDSMDSDKKLKHLIPNDSRIKIVNISKKDNDGDYVKYPFGIRLNLAAKYATNDVLIHLFDDHVYSPENICNMVKSYLVAGKDALVCVDSAVYDRKNNRSIVQTKPDLGGMIYHKRLWKVGSFEENVSQDNVANMFIKNRSNCFGGIPFTSSTFSIQTIDNLDTDTEVLPFCLGHLVPTSMKESYELFLESFN